ncbi:MAG: phosphoenolpyruvate--protein phosphotransferase, partial [Phycisphaerae bacterium]|nr:phosphoenolpyruvate--protein phosphotransferase [Phycisphaerae bacterium]
MEIRRGIAVSPGVAICPAVVLDAEDIHVPRRTVPHADLPHQHARLDEALGRARQDLEGLRDQVTEDLGHETAAIFGFHLGMLHDEHLMTQINGMIDSEQVTAEYALATAMRSLAQVFLKQSSPLFRERVHDIWDLEKRVLHHLIDDVRADLQSLDHDAVIVAHDLTPSQTASLDKSKIKALVIDAGGRTSHTAIVARALGIPAVVGLESAAASIATTDMLIVDANRGVVIINPDPEQLEEYEQYVQRIGAFERKLVDIAELPSVTTDGVEIDLQANIEFHEEIPQALANGATGIGLYRTEYLYLSTETEPDEAQQYEAFSAAVRLLDGRPLTIRTLDLGADKYTQKQAETPEPNPFLGCRSIRFCLQNLSMFKIHLRAILRASALGPMRVMFPLISNVIELRQARMILHDVMEDLDDEGIDFNRNLHVGMMIEVPSAAL